MRTVTIEISDARAAALKAAVDAGEFGSAAESVNAALAAHFDEGGHPDPDTLERASMRSRRASGVAKRR